MAKSRDRYIVLNDDCDNIIENSENNKDIFYKKPKKEDLEYEEFSEAIIYKLVPIAKVRKTNIVIDEIRERKK